MRRTILSTILLLLTACATAPQSMEQSVDRVLARHSRQTIAVAYLNLEDGSSLYRNERELFHAASTMKVPVMLGIFEAVTRGELRLDQPVVVRNDFVSIFDGSHYSLTAEADSDPELYKLVGTSLPLEALVRRMIDRSSNLSTNIVIELISAERVMRLMKEIGANDVRVLRGVEDQKAFDHGMNNMTTAYDLTLIMRTIAESRAISPEASRTMMAILAAQEFNSAIPAGLPSSSRVAHKTGNITLIAHDSGIVTLADGRRYVLTVLTRGFKKTEQANKVIAEVSRAIYRSLAKVH
jgi:beta-lactamase class A